MRNGRIESASCDAFQRAAIKEIAMRSFARKFTVFALIAFPGVAVAQDPHHPASPASEQAAPGPKTNEPATPQANQPAAPAGGMNCPMMGQMGEMGQMMGRMGQMMGQMGQMMGGATMGGGMGKDMPGMDSLPDASRAYMDAMTAMQGSMVAAMQSKNPDVAFVKGMIPHHQAAIDMAKAALKYGSDDQVRIWANEIIKVQQAEIDAMHKWLKARGE